MNLKRKKHDDPPTVDLVTILLSSQWGAAFLLALHSGPIRRTRSRAMHYFNLFRKCIIVLVSFSCAPALGYLISPTRVLATILEWLLIFYL